MRRHERLRWLSLDWGIVDVSWTACGQAGKMKSCHVRARFPVSGDSLEAGELMAAKFAPGHSSRLLSPAVVASGEATGLAGHLQGSFKLTIRGEQSI